MDNIWDRKSFEVGGHCPLWREWKKRMTKQNRQKSNAKKQKTKPKQNWSWNSTHSLKTNDFSRVFLSWIKLN